MTYLDALGRELHLGDLVVAAVSAGRSSGTLHIGTLAKEPGDGVMLKIELLKPIENRRNLRRFANVNYDRNSILRINDEKVYSFDNL